MRYEQLSSTKENKLFIRDSKALYCYDLK